MGIKIRRKPVFQVTDSMESIFHVLVFFEGCVHVTAMSNMKIKSAMEKAKILNVIKESL